MFGGFVYWADGHTSSVMRARTLTGEEAQVVHSGILGLEDVIVFTGSYQQTGQNTFSFIFFVSLIFTGELKK